MYDPSARPTSFVVRTITAFVTSPFLTLAFGIASFTDTTMMSPSDAYLRRLPPSTLMHSTLRAPELSATSKTVSDCTMSHPTGQTRRCTPSHRLFEDGAHRPAFVAAERPRLGDQDAIAYDAAVVFVMRLHLRPARSIFFVLRVLHQAFDGNNHRLVHFFTDHDTLTGLGVSSR